VAPWRWRRGGDSPLHAQLLLPLFAEERRKDAEVIAKIRQRLVELQEKVSMMCPRRAALARLTAPDRPGQSGHSTAAQATHGDRPISFPLARAHHTSMQAAVHSQSHMLDSLSNEDKRLISVSAATIAWLSDYESKFQALANEYDSLVEAYG
jgi:hypothetical protein